MASRILGMGDVLSLIEKAEEAVEEDEQEALEERMLRGEFTFDDFLSSTAAAADGAAQDVLS